MSQFKSFELIWDDEMLSRLWGFYSKTSPFKDNYFAKLLGDAIIELTVDKIGNLNNKIILDFGCGPGFLISHLQKMTENYKYIGLDFSKETIEQNRREYKELINCKFIYTTKLPTDLPDGFIDLCFLIEVLEHLDQEKLQSTLREIHRFLKKDGILVITVPNEEDLELSKCFCPNCGAVFHRMQHVTSWSKESLVETLGNFNFAPWYIKKLDLAKYKNRIMRFFSFGELLIRFFLKKRKKQPNLFAIFKKQQ